MNFVEPIRDRKQVAHIKNLLKGQGRYRDLLQLRIGDFMDESGKIRPRFWLREEKRTNAMKW